MNENHPDAPALQVLNAAMEGFNGILYQELREKRNLGYSAFLLAHKMNMLALLVMEL